MPDINDLIVALYDDAVPLQNIVGLPANFKVPRRNLEVSLFHGQPQTPEESDSMEADAHIAVEMMITLGVLKVVPKEGAENENTKNEFLEAGTEFVKFVKAVKEYIDHDSIIIRTLGISRQDFDGICREYTELMKEVKSLDDIFESWAELSPDAKMGIVRGVLVQRTIMADIINRAAARQKASLQHGQETLKWLTSTLT